MKDILLESKSSIVILIAIVYQLVKLYMYFVDNQQKGECLFIDTRKLNYNYFKSVVFLILIFLATDSENTPLISSIILIIFLLLAFINSLIRGIRRVRVYDDGVLTFDRYLTWDKIESSAWVHTKKNYAKVHFIYDTKKESSSYCEIRILETDLAKMENLIKMKIKNMDS